MREKKREEEKKEEVFIVRYQRKASADAPLSGSAPPRNAANKGCKPRIR